MRQKYFFFLIFIMTSVVVSAQRGDRDAYIRKYRKIAIKEMRRAGIPASIKLGQGILESGAGSSTLARKANNHFGIKCHNDWDGKRFYREDDDYDENGRLIKSCFRVYRNAEASYIAHSEFLTDPRKRFRYGPLFQLDPLDYKAWARGLKRAGYATSPTYAEKLIRIIETYQLYQYDEEATIDDGRPSRNRRDEIAGIRRNNHVKYVLANGTETVSEISRRTDTKADCIVKFNEEIRNTGDQPILDTRVYLQRKRNGFRGKQKWHYVKEGETMFSISQLYGVKLKKLLKRNRMEKNQLPAVGERVKIRGWKVSKSNRPKLSGEKYQPPIDTRPTPNVVVPRPTEEDDEEFNDFFEPEFPEEEGGFIPPEDPTWPPIPPTTEPPSPDPTIIDPPVVEPETPEPPVSEPINTEPELEQVYYTVKRGDTLYNIGRRYGVSVARIKALNNLTSNIIGIGQQLRIQ